MIGQEALRFGVRILGCAALIAALGGCPRSTAPKVSFTNPPDGATNVAIARKITATFTEFMNASTINTSTFTLMQGATPVPGTVDYAGVTAIFDPAVVLAPNTLYTATITTGAEALRHGWKEEAGDKHMRRLPWWLGRSHRPLEENYVWTFTTGDSPDVVAPLVSSTDPVDGAVGVLLGRNLSATFSEGMDPLSITTDTFTLHQGVTPVAGVVTYSGVTAVFNPSSPLAAATSYTATITAGAADLAGNTMLSDYTWDFTTGDVVDTIAPEVSFTDPEHLATEVAVNKKIAVVFTEAMDPLTITTETYTLFRGSTQVEGIVTYVGTTATFTPTGGLAANTTYTAAISLDAADLAGNTLGGNFVWLFTTGDSADTFAPEVSFIDPWQGESDIAINTKIAATFTEVMDPFTITPDSFTVFRGSTQVFGAVTYAGLTAVFSPTGGLEPNTPYTVAISSEATDLAGNSLPGSYVWIFTTSESLDITPPEVSFTDPENAALGVAINKKIAVSFTETMDPTTINSVAYTVYQGPTRVQGTVTYVGLTATFAPVGGLEPNTTYTAAVSSEATDLAGNPLPGNFVWIFTTGDAPDTTAPEVFFTDPVNVAPDVPVNQTIDVTFTEAMDPLTVTAVTFTVDDGLARVTGIVTYAGITATFSPLADLAPNTTYTATVAMEASDLAGNSLPGDYVWTFTTIAAR